STCVTTTSRSVGTSSRLRLACRSRSSPARGRATWRPTRRSAAPASTSGTELTNERAGERHVRFAARIDVTHLPGVLDPQGATVERALPALAHSNVRAVSIAKTSRLELDADSEDAARAQVDEM